MQILISGTPNRNIFGPAGFLCQMGSSGVGTIQLSTVSVGTSLLGVVQGVRLAVDGAGCGFICYSGTTVERANLWSAPVSPGQAPPVGTPWNDTTLGSIVLYTPQGWASTTSVGL